MYNYDQLYMSAERHNKLITQNCLSVCVKSDVIAGLCKSKKSCFICTFVYQLVFAKFDVCCLM